MIKTLLSAVAGVALSLGLASAAITTTAYDITTTPVEDNVTFYTACFVYQQDGSAANLSDSVIVDVSAISNMSNAAISEITAVSSDAAINLLFEFDASTDDPIIEFGPAVTAGNVMKVTFPADGLVDPQSSGGTGDVLLTTTAFGANENVFICVKTRKIP